MIRFQGSISKDGKYWLIEVPLFNAMTQGMSRKEALHMIKDYFDCTLDNEAVHVFVQSLTGNTFELWSEPIAPLFALLLRRQRQLAGLTLADVAKRLGTRSTTAYNRYELGTAVPSIEKLNQLLNAVSTEKHFTLSLAA
jgi:predicted RNase H-like HicB family nuclease